MAEEANKRGITAAIKLTIAEAIKMATRINNKTKAIKGVEGKEGFNLRNHLEEQTRTSKGLIISQEW